MNKKEKLEEIGRLCKKYRRIKKIRQIDIAKDLGVSISTISLFENGKSDSLYVFLAYIKNDIITNI